jgi:lysocardiolipin and lysophospholipid acyltransferase
LRLPPFFSMALRRLRAAVGIALIVMAVLVDGLVFFPVPAAALGASASLLSLVPTTLPLARVFYSLYRRLTSLVTALFFLQVAAVLELVYGIRYVTYGDPIQRATPSLLIANHRTRLDWAMLWPFLAPTDPFDFSSSSPLLLSLRIVLKSDIKAIPIIGWATAAARFLFLDRRWETDEPHIAKMLALLRCGADAAPALAASGEGGKEEESKGGGAVIVDPYLLLLFPEGTDLAPVNRERSRAFARERGLVDYDYILHPRAKGFIHALSLLREPLSVARASGGDDVTVRLAGAQEPYPTPPPQHPSQPQPHLITARRLELVHDVTIAYRGPIPQREGALVSGATPTEVHVMSRAYSADAIPGDAAGAERWLLTRFAEKEASLRDFCTGGGPLRQADALREVTEGAPGPRAAVGPVDCRLTTRTPLPRSTPFGAYFAALVLHAAVLAAAVAVALTSPLASAAYVATTAVVCGLVLPRRCGGADRLEASCCLRPRTRQHRPAASKKAS